MSMWRTRLQQASFRGVEFGVNAAADAAGRQTVTHTFPQRDNPYVEDMGPATRTIQLTAFVVGRDYLSRRDSLQQACEKTGPGTLIHPWYGSINVALTAPAQIAHSADSGGMCTFSLQFVRVDATESTSASVNPHALTRERANICSALAADYLQSRMMVLGYGDYVLQSATGALLTAIGGMSSTLGIDPLSVAPWVDSALDGLMLYNMVKNDVFGTNFVGLLVGMAAQLPFTAQGQNPAPLFSITNTAPVVIVPSPAGASRTAVATNAKAIAEAQRQAATIEALRYAAFYTPSTRSEAMSLRGDIMDAVDETSLRCEDDTLFAALADLRAASLQAFSLNAGRAPDVVQVVEQSTRPSLAIAYRYTGTVSAAEDIVSRNNIRHPAFVRGGQPLELTL